MESCHNSLPLDKCWPCPSCTFINKSEDQICEVCESPKDELLKSEVNLENKIEIDADVKEEPDEEDLSDPDDPKEDISEFKMEEVEEIELTEDSSYACEECDWVGKTKTAVIAHKFKHTGGARLSCKYCDFKTNYPQNMYVHKLNKHADIAAFSCDSCSFKTLMEKKLTKHLKDFPNGICKEEDIKKKLMKMIKLDNCPKPKPKKDKLFSCSECDYVINDKRLLTSHMAKHTGAKMFSCKECDFKSNHRASIHNHMKEVHTSEMKYTCDVCMFKSNLMYKMRKHEKDKKNGVCQKIWNSDTGITDGLKSPQKSIVTHKCKHCEYRIPSGHVHLHYKENHPNLEKPFACEECSYGCYWKLNLRKHVEAVHKGITHQCHVCTFNTKWYVALNQHLRITHNIRKRKPNDEKEGRKEEREAAPRTENLCDLCGYKTLYGSNMKSHQRSVHKIGLKPGQTEAKPKVMRFCEFCDYKTVYNSNLISHKRSKHKIGLKEGEEVSKPKVLKYCEFCEYKTVYGSNLLSHRRNVHKNLIKTENGNSVEKSQKPKVLKECDFCDYKTVYSSNLLSHRRNVHKGLLVK